MGRRSPRDLRLELFYEAANCSLSHKWQAGDVLMVDNQADDARQGGVSRSAEAHIRENGSGDILIRKTTVKRRWMNKIRR